MCTISHITDDIGVAVAGERSIVTLKAITFEDQLCEESIESFELELVSEITGTRVSCSAEKRGQSTYEISYKPTMKGVHSLHIKVNGKHIYGSPFTVAVRSSSVNFSTPILTIGGVKDPMCIATNKKGQTVVCELNNPCVSPGGKKLLSLHTDFVSPRGVAMGDEGNIFVADCGHIAFRNSQQMVTLLRRWAPAEVDRCSLIFHRRCFCKRQAICC